MLTSKSKGVYCSGGEHEYEMSWVLSKRFHPVLSLTAHHRARGAHVASQAHALALLRQQANSSILIDCDISNNRLYSGRY